VRQEFPAIFCQKRDKNEPKKEKKKSTRGKKKGQKPRYFSFFQGETISTQSFLPDARALSATRLWCANTRTHTQKLLVRVEFVRKKRYATRRCLFFARVLVASLSPTKRGARVEISRVGTVFSLSFSREKRSSKNTKHTTVLAFPIRAKRKRKRRTKRDAKETNAHRRLLRARRKERRAFFFVVPPSALFLSLLIARESWRASSGERIFRWKKKRALSLGREGGGSPSHLSKKEDKKRRQKTECLGYQTDTKIFLVFLVFSSKKGRDGTN
jgi:hypothetical protein